MEADDWQQGTMEAGNDADMDDQSPEAAGSPQDDQQDPAQPLALSSKPAAAPGKELYRHVGRIRGQHRNNLVALLRRSLQEGDFSTAAGAAGTLLAALPPGVEKLGLATTSAASLVQLVHVLWSSIELLQQHAAPQDQVKRALRCVASLLVETPSMRQAAQLQLILHTWKWTSPSAALDLITHEEAKAHMAGPGSSTPFAAHLAWIAALIKHGTWFRQVLSLQSTTSQAQTQSSSQAPAQATISPSHLMGPLQLPSGPLPSLAARVAAAAAHSQQQQQSQPVMSLSQAPGGVEGASDALDDAAVDLELQLRGVLRMSPGASQPALLLCQLMLLSGRHSEAAAVAATAAAASGMSPELLSLWALLSEHTALAAAAAAAAGTVMPAVHGSNGVYGMNSDDVHAMETDGMDDDAMDMEADIDLGTAGDMLDEAGPSTAAPAAAAAGGGAGAAAAGGGDATAAETTDNAGTAALHGYVTVCEEVLLADPWALGAVEGLVQVSSHCHSCTAAAVRGLLNHLDPLLTEAAAGSVAATSSVFVGSAGPATAAASSAAAGSAAALVPGSQSAREAAPCSNSSGAADVSAMDACLSAAMQLYAHTPRWWVVLSGLLLQLASAAAAAGPSSLTHPSSHQEPGVLAGDASAGAAGVSAGAGEGAAAGGSTNHQPEGPGSSPVAAGTEGGNGSGHPACPWQLWQQLQQQCFAVRQHWWPLTGLPSTHELSWLHRLLQLQQQGVQQLHQQDMQQHQQHQEDIQRQDAFEVAEWLLMLQCSKAISLGFILGQDNTYSTAVAAALQVASSNPAAAAAAAAAAATAPAGAAAAQGCSPGQSQDGGGSSGKSLLQRAAEASAALKDALQLARHLQQLQQQQQQQRRQQQQQQQPMRHFGPPSEEYGVLLDLPDAWWAAFPHRRRLARQQQQQQAMDAANG